MKSNLVIFWHVFLFISFVLGDDTGTSNSTSPVPTSTDSVLSTTPSGVSPFNDTITNVFLWNKSYKKGIEAQILKAQSSKSINGSKFIATIKSYLLVHDIGGTPHDLQLLKLKDKLLEKGDCNVLSVEWNAGKVMANETHYNLSLKAVPSMGKQVANFLHQMKVLKGLQYSSLHVIAVGLGAHIAGAAGHDDEDSPIQSITGLDPSGVHVSVNDKNKRLDESDAKYVQVIHTNSCKESKPSTWFECYGAYFSMGNTDFYPNGPYQPHCDKHHQHTSGTGKGRPPFCDHNLALTYYLESMDISLSDTVYLARPAKDWNHFKLGPLNCGKSPQYLGYYADPSGLGDYFLETAEDDPYGIGDAKCPTSLRYSIKTISYYTALVLFIACLVLIPIITIGIIIHKRRQQKASGSLLRAQVADRVDFLTQSSSDDDDDDELIESSSSGHLLDVDLGESTNANTTVSNLLDSDLPDNLLDAPNTEMLKTNNVSQLLSLGASVGQEAPLLAGVPSTADQTFDSSLVDVVDEIKPVPLTLHDYSTLMVNKN